MRETKETNTGNYMERQTDRHTDRDTQREKETLKQRDIERQTLVETKITDAVSGY